MREAHPLTKRVAETLEIGDDEDLFGRHDHRTSPARMSARTERQDGDGEPSFGDALRSLLGSTTVGNMG